MSTSFISDGLHTVLLLNLFLPEGKPEAVTDVGVRGPDTVALTVGLLTSNPAQIIQVSDVPLTFSCFVLTGLTCD